MTAVKDSINLSHKSLTCEDIVKLSEEFNVDHSIRTLKLGFNDLRDEGAIFISDLLRNNSTLTCLDLGFCGIGDRGIESLATSLATNITIRILYLSGNLLTATGFKHIGNALLANKTLSALYLTGNNAKSDGAKQLAKGLKYNYSIEKLFLNGNKLEKEGASSLSDILAINHTITHLNLSDNNIGDQGLISLSEAMTSHRNINDLELSFNKITVVGIGSFIDSIAGYRNLSRLLLDNNKLQGAGAKTLALALPHMQLQELNIAFNDIDPEGLLAIVNSVTQSLCLQILTLSGNVIDKTVSVALAHMLSSNITLTALYVDHTNLSTSGEMIVGSGIARNRKGTLQILTGMDLGKVLVQLGSPAQLGEMSNENALKYLAQIWAMHERQIFTDASSRLFPSDMFNGSSNRKVLQSAVKSESTNVIINAAGSHVRNHSPAPLQPISKSASVKYEEDVKKIRNLPAALVAARDLWALPFNSNDMWDLHQYFFAPPQTTVNLPSESEESVDSEDESRNIKRASPDTSSTDNNSTTSSDVPRKRQVKSSHERPRGTSGPRPKKRASNRNTVARIAYYPVIKNRLESYKAAVDEVKALTLLRQLRLLEKALQGVEPSIIERLLLEEVHDVAL